MYTLQGKLDQHSTCFPRSVRVWSTIICISRGSYIATFHTVVNRFEQIHCTWEEWLSTQFQHTGRPIRGFVPSISPTTANGAVGKSQASVDNRLLDLPGLYHRYVIGTFNTCSWGSTHWSLTDIGGGYNLGGVSLPRNTPQPSRPAVFPFHLRVCPVSSLTNFSPLNLSVEF
jgi:hypothetical protein